MTMDTSAIVSVVFHAFFSIGDIEFFDYLKMISKEMLNATKRMAHLS